MTHIDADVVGERTVNSMPFWDGNDWHQWIPLSNGQLSDLRIRGLVQGNYLAKSRAEDTDIFIQFVHFMWQHASWPEICPLIVAISDDFHNIATSIAKIRHFHDGRGSLKAVAIHCRAAANCYQFSTPFSTFG